MPGLARPLLARPFSYNHLLLSPTLALCGLLIGLGLPKPSNSLTLPLRPDPREPLLSADGENGLPRPRWAEALKGDPESSSGLAFALPRPESGLPRAARREVAGELTGVALRE